MKINIINNANFKGIKIARKPNKEKVNLRSIQTSNMENAKRQMGIFDNITKTNLQGETGAVDKFIRQTQENETFKSSAYDDGQSFYEEKAQTMKKAYSEIETKAKGEEGKFNAINQAIKANLKQDIADIVPHDESRRIGLLRQEQNLPGMEKVAGYDYERSVLDREFIQKIKLEKQGQDIDIPSSVLFFGPTGNGKTSITMAIADETGCNIIELPYLKDMTRILDIAMVSEKQFAANRTRTIIFIDELEKAVRNDSPIKDEFFDFIKDCSKKYHCSVFATTNNPLDLGADFNNPDIFPVVMSIDPPNKTNKIKIIEHYIKDFDINTDSKKILLRVSEKEEEENAIFTNEQIKSLCVFLREKLTSDSTLDEADKLMDKWFKKNGNKPQINEQRVQKFQHDYDVVMREREINED